MPDDEKLTAEGGSSLAARLDWLFEHVRDKDGREFSQREVARRITEAGEPISHAYIAQLRRGAKTDPTLGHLRALAHFFGVPVEYFTSEEVAAGARTELTLVAALQGLKAQTVALRDSIMPDAAEAIAAMSRLMDTIREIDDRRNDGRDGL
ncbi:helix-turn-helix domain-containing protein [Paractinoplanes hotanensis]|uniref:Helix-turn-helix transcriptional regulator n=1 Tax=Paractinoplanes hotanensis TaxID=2906497 RepID=A0ABT0YCY1_9ACTN|nr:helix-turn-helix transcriptional regulator [Actinoplanes hotanensis]MCM4083917.1 helix-turn-helix transcriptional regulator [Actinoplanes hotanensis]